MQTHTHTGGGPGIPTAVDVLKVDRRSVVGYIFCFHCGAGSRAQALAQISFTGVRGIRNGETLLNTMTATY